MKAIAPDRPRTNRANEDGSVFVLIDNLITSLGTAVWGRGRSLNASVEGAVVELVTREVPAYPVPTSVHPGRLGQSGKHFSGAH